MRVERIFDVDVEIAQSVFVEIRTRAINPFASALVAGNLAAKLAVRGSDGSEFGEGSHFLTRQCIDFRRLSEHLAEHVIAVAIYVDPPFEIIERILRIAQRMLDRP